MFPFNDANSNGSNCGGFEYNGFSSKTLKTYQEFDSNNFAGDWPGEVNTQLTTGLDPFGLGPIAFPEAYPQAGPSTQNTISRTSYWDAAGQYEGSAVFDTAANTISNPFETMFPPSNGLAGTGKPRCENLDRFVR